MKSAIREAVTRQEALGLDVLVHGEAERNDMVEYFGELMDGYVFTENGWVQSYGFALRQAAHYLRRCLEAGADDGGMGARYAQAWTGKPMKGMLSGPITMLFWSFVRDDLPRDEVAMQLALALRQEVCDLEAAGIKVIQIDEPAIREGLPLEEGCLAALPGLGGARVPRHPFRVSAPIRRSIRICAIRSSTTSCRRSPRWTPTSSPLRPPVPG